MKTLLLLLLFSVAFARYSPGYWKAKERSKGFENWKTTKPLTPDYDEDYDDEDSDIPRARWCVSSKCELRKCKRMTMELNYKSVPKMRWSCVMASSIIECMKYVEKGHADLMSIPGKKIYKAGKYHNLNPILMEKFDTKLVKKYQSRFARFEKNGFMKHYSVALVKKTSSIRRFEDLKDKRSCHYDIATHASFKNPICSLIHKKVIPVKGNVYESAAAYFEKSCAPGAKTKGSWWNRNGTMPDSMCSLCKGTDKNFCEMKKGEPLFGYKGALKCLDDDEGHVGFFHTYDIMKNYDKLHSKYSLVCEDQQHKLKWEHIMKKKCHLNVEYPNVIVVHKTKSNEWKTKCSQVLQKAVQQFDPLKVKNRQSSDFSLFRSDPYCPTTDEDVLYRKTNLIFNDNTSNFLPVTKGTTYKTFLDDDIIKMWDHCKALRPKPRAFICVVGNQEKAKCRKMKEYFTQKPVTDTISWGCIEADDRYQCMGKVKRGEADIVSLNATEMFIAGRDFNLSPFIGENYNNKQPWTESITVGVMRQDNRKSTKKLNDLKMCFRGDQTLTSYYHPIGWLMSNGTIPHQRDHTLTRFFTQGCWPGIDKLDFTKDHISRHLMDWYEFATGHKVDWTTWYQTPDWRKWEQNVVYNRWHKIYDYQSDMFNYLKMKMYTEKPWIHHMHTHKWHEMIKKVKTTFNWENYDFHDFYDFFPKFKFFLKLYEKTQFKTEQEWDAFMDWVGPQWDSEVDCAEHNKWTAKDWTDFKRWMDYEYADYIKKDKDKEILHKDTFIRFYIYCNRFDWLKKQWKKLQWTLPKYKDFRKQFCKTCTGPAGKECSMSPQDEITSNHKGILHCVYNKAGELGFVDAYTLEGTINKHSFQRSYFVLLCPDGTKVNYTGPQSFKECNFGRVPSRALVTCNNHDGVWRWAVTKAFLEAQKIFKGSRWNEWNFNMFEGDSIFSKNTNRLSPIELTDQTYQQWLGPKLLRSLEGLFYNTPSKNEIDYLDDYDDDSDDHDDDDDEDYTDYNSDDDNDYADHDDDDDDYDDDNDYADYDDDDDDDDDDYDDDDDDDDDDYKDNNKNPRRTRTDTKLSKRYKKRQNLNLRKKESKRISRKNGRFPKQRKSWRKMGPYTKLMKKTFKGLKRHKNMRLMLHKSTRPMGHKFMVWPNKFMSGYHHVSRDTMRPQGELYSTVIKTRNNTCSAISQEIVCFGKKNIVQRWVGRISKTLVSIPLCPKPSAFVKRYIEFTCNTGAGYISPVMSATKCSYLPCSKRFWVPAWSLDNYWKGENLYKGEKHWGTEVWWNPVNHVTNKNWFLEHKRKMSKRMNPLNKQRRVGQKWRSE